MAKSPAKARIERERSRFTQLVAANPNHFGNLEASDLKATKKIASNTNYEELTCVGLNPGLDLLQATIQIKRPFGYAGDLCHGGSTEYVRFFLSYDDGATWENAGLAAVDVHDIPNRDDCADKPNKPLVYVLTQEIEPKRDFCGRPILPRVRAILSWQAIPPADKPNQPPVWGNRLDRHVQIKPRPPWFVDVVAIAGGKLEKVPLEFEPAFEAPIPLPDPPPLQLEQLAELYGAGGSKKSQAKVEPQRFGFSEVQAALKTGDVDTDLITAKISEWQGLGLQWTEAIEALLEGQGNTSYEELDCLGLDYRREHLAATFRIKRPTGYLGGLCAHGSKEYVAFWADWDDTCEWQYLGTAEVKVHDIAQIPSDGLAYSVILPVDLDAERRPCSKPKVGRVRAVLSWNSPPSTTDPDDVPYWGNRLDTHVLIRPGRTHDGKARITVLGGIGIDDVATTTDGLTDTDARFALQGTLADWLGRRCPFGGRVVINGPSVVGAKYRARARPVFGGGAGTVLDTRLWVVDLNGVGSWHYADASGYFTFLPYVQNFFGTLAYFDTGSDNGLWEVRLEVEGPGPISYTTPWHRLRLDNTKPTAEISLDAGACEQFKPGVTLTGKFVARDPNFGRFSLVTLPSSVSPPSPSPSSGTSQTSPTPGDVWTLSTTGMDPCGYVVKLHVWDRTIRNSGPGSHNYDTDDVGFCLIK